MCTHRLNLPLKILSFVIFTGPPTSLSKLFVISIIRNNFEASFEIVRLAHIPVKFKVNSLPVANATTDQLPTLKKRVC